MTKEMNHQARELVLYIENTSKVYFQTLVPVYSNIAKKMSKGTFEKEKASKAFYNVAVVGAKAYHLEHGDHSTPWHKVFSVEDRKQAAEHLLESFLSDFELF